MSALLTIAIPTYNRAGDLDNLLASIVRELKKVATGTVEVLVSDNASEDNTTAIVEKHQKTCPHIRYSRNKTNLGMQANFVQCIQLCAGEYLYMIGDDEVIVEDGLFIMLDAIQNNKNVSVFIYNYTYEGLPQEPLHLKQACGHAINTNVINVREFVFQHGWLWTLGNLAMVTVRAAPLKAMDYTPHMAHYFMQAAVYLEAFHNDLLLFVNRAVFHTFIRSQTVNKERWEYDGSVACWPRIFDSVDFLIAKGVLPPALPITFYNHCSSAWYPSWNLLLDHMLKRMASGDLSVTDESWNEVIRWIVKVDNAPMRDRILTAVESLRTSYNISKNGFANFVRLTQLLRPALSGL